MGFCSRDLGLGLSVHVRARDSIFAVIHKGTDLYDKRVFKRVFSPEEWDDLVFLNDRSVHGDEAVERIYRAKGL